MRANWILPYSNVDGNNRKRIAISSIPQLTVPVLVCTSSAVLRLSGDVDHLKSNEPPLQETATTMMRMSHPAAAAHVVK